jgi:transcriptional regulator with GAF, ATPase, and Fis domain
VVLRKLWQGFDEINRDIVLHLVHLNPPVSIDTLIALSGAPAGTVLSFMEELKKKKLVSAQKGYRKGVYFLDGEDLTVLVQQLVSEEDKRRIIRRIIDFYARSLDEGTEKALILAQLYAKLGDREEGLAYMKTAGDILLRSGESEKAIVYYDRILEWFKNREPTGESAKIFVESVLVELSAARELRPAREQMTLIARVEEIARRYEIWELMARIKLELAAELHVAGKSRQASKSIDDFRELARKIGDPAMSKRVALAMSELLFYEGRILEAALCYEEAIGDLEEFGDDEATLRIGALVGWCHVICGRIARGMGMIEAIRVKAHLLSFQKIIIIADLLRVHALLEIRRIGEAEAILNRNSVSLPLGDIYYHLMQWTALTCRAYILYAKEDYEGAFACHRKAVEHLPSLGWMPRNNPWSLEYIGALESRGFFHKKMNFEAEIERLVAGHDIYMKGFALRYRALRNVETQQSQSTILADLRRSEKYLKMAGAEIELARTRVALGNHYLDKRDTKTAQSYLEKAWRLFSTVDRSLFPAHLMAILPQKEKTEFMMSRLADINQSIGIIRDTSSFLQRVINVAMDFTMATWGAFVVLEGGEPKIIASRNIDPSFSNTKGFKAIRNLMLDVSREGMGSIALGLDEGDNGFDRTLEEAGVSSFISMPAKLGANCFGYLCLGNLLGDRPEDNCLPFLETLCSQIAVGLSNIGMYNEMKELKDRFEDEAIFYKQEMGIAAPLEMIIGRSEGIIHVTDQIRQVASTDSSVLILGETGVGKELVAKAIHTLSPRKEGPFIPVNLAALPQELVASELFGHEKGAFTGANDRKKGRIELANGGTIFLDEIGDLPAHAQVTLLRVLQEGTFERLGSAKPIQSNFRVIASTNKDLHLDVEKGTFRQDLYYRLNVFPIYVPPLRQRKDDIPPLAHLFVDRYSRKLGKRIRRIPADEMKRLLDYNWPGNVRELEHFIERAVILSDGHGISFAGLEYVPTNGIPAEDSHGTATLVDLERKHIEKVLSSTNWRVSGPYGAASILGLKATTLFARMRKLGVKRP